MTPRSTSPAKAGSKKTMNANEKGKKTKRQTAEKRAAVEASASEDNADALQRGNTSPKTNEKTETDILLTERGFLVPCGTGKKRKTMELFENYLFRPKRSKTDYTAHYYKEAPSSKNSSFDSDIEAQLRTGESTMPEAHDGDDDDHHVTKDATSRPLRRPRPTTTSESSEDSTAARISGTHARTLASDFEERGGGASQVVTGDGWPAESMEEGLGRRNKARDSVSADLDDTLEASQDHGAAPSPSTRPPMPMAERREERGRRKKGKAERRIVAAGPIFAPDVPPEMDAEAATKLTPAMEAPQRTVSRLSIRCVEYRAICSSSRSFTSTAYLLSPHCLPSSRALLRSFFRSLAHSLTRSRGQGKEVFCLVMRPCHTASSYCAPAGVASSRTGSVL